MASVAKSGVTRPLGERERRQLQHELKIYMEKYFKSKLGKGVDHTEVTIWEDLLVIRGEGFLTEPEKYIVNTAEGQELVSSAACMWPSGIPGTTSPISNSCCRRKSSMNPFWWMLRRTSGCMLWSSTPC